MLWFRIWRGEMKDNKGSWFFFSAWSINSSCESGMQKIKFNVQYLCFCDIGSAIYNDMFVTMFIIYDWIFKYMYIHTHHIIPCMLCSLCSIHPEHISRQLGTVEKRTALRWRIWSLIHTTLGKMNWNPSYPKVGSVGRCLAMACLRSHEQSVYLHGFLVKPASNYQIWPGEFFVCPLC